MTEKWKEQFRLEQQIFSAVESSSVAGQRPLTTLVFSSRLSPFDLASLAKYFIDEGERPDGPGAVIRLACETFAELVRLKHPETVFNEPGQAIRFLEAQGLLKGKNQNSKRAMRFMAFESLLEETRPVKEQDLKLENFRMVVRTMIKLGQQPSAEQLDKAQMTITGGQATCNEHVNKETNYDLKQ